MNGRISKLIRNALIVYANDLRSTPHKMCNSHMEEIGLADAMGESLGDYITVDYKGSVARLAQILDSIKDCDEVCVDGNHTDNFQLQDQGDTPYIYFPDNDDMEIIFYKELKKSYIQGNGFVFKDEDGKEHKLQLLKLQVMPV